MIDHRDRGRGAERPTAIPAKGWKDVLYRVKDQIGDDRVTLVAAGVTFYILLALIPGLTALVSVYGLFSDPESVQSHLERFEGVIPGGGMEILGSQLERISGQASSTLGFAFAGSLAISMWSANAGVKAMFEAMNVAYNERESRGFIKLNLITLAFTLAGLVAVIVAMGLLVFLPPVLGSLGFGSMGQAISRVAGIAILAVLALAGLAALYRYGPSREEAEWRWITPGAIVTLVVWVIGSVLFTWYAANFGSYNATYGSLGSLIGFLFWIWISTNIVIIGAELNAELEHQTAMDTTEGDPEPLGERGAHVADTVGEPR
ncbi:MAG TPA: YihY/virulence factor BrkB family protein [Methylomirabilota bacterium]|nr:YihY/virulence factor BrkB family protein [Methylomirabilota bacterium]